MAIAGKVHLKKSEIFCSTILVRFTTSKHNKLKVNLKFEQKKFALGLKHATLFQQLVFILNGSKLEPI